MSYHQESTKSSTFLGSEASPVRIASSSFETTFSSSLVGRCRLWSRSRLFILSRRSFDSLFSVNLSQRSSYRFMTRYWHGSNRSMAIQTEWFFHFKKASLVTFSVHSKLCNICAVSEIGISASFYGWCFTWKNKQCNRVHFYSCRRTTLLVQNNLCALADLFYTFISNLIIHDYPTL